jgi:hypothetical protein
VVFIVPEEELPRSAYFFTITLMRSLAMLEKGLKRRATICLRSVFLQLLVLHFWFGLIYGAAYPRQEQQQREALGSLTTAGEVFLNSADAPAESTVFAGDVLRTSPSGTAMFTLAGNGSFRISPNTEILFAGGPQYAAELKLGKVVMNSLNGTMGITLRAGSSVVVAVAEGEQSTSSIEAPSDGSFLISCLGGSVGVVPLQGGKGIFIREGQSVSVSPQGELSAMSTQAEVSAAAPGSTETAPAARQKHSHAHWILIGVGAAGAVAAAAILSTSGSGVSVNSPTVSASSGIATTPASNPPTSDAPGPPQPTPPQPTPPQPQPPPTQPPSQPDPPGGNGCHHHKKNCQQHVVIGFAFHF